MTDENEICDEDHEGYVYFVRCPLNEFTKIGYSWANPESRFLAIQVSSPVPVERYAIMKGGRLIELDLHFRFANHCDHAEWFKPSPELEAFIAEYTDEWLPGIGNARKRKRVTQEEVVSTPVARPRRKTPEYVLSDEDSTSYMLGLKPGEEPLKRQRMRYGPLQAMLDKLAAEKDSTP